MFYKTNCNFLIEENENAVISELNYILLSFVSLKDMLADSCVKYYILGTTRYFYILIK